LVQRRLEISRPVVFVQEIAKRLVRKLLECLHRVAREQIQRLPGLRIKFHELAPDGGRLFGHDEPPAPPGTTPAPTRSPRDGPRESRTASTLPRREGARGEIILGRRWPRIVFIGALAMPVVLPLALMTLP
jgi:hypothetical protein